MRVQSKTPGAPAALVLLLSIVCPAVLNAEVRHVRAGDNLQAALNAANPGDTLLLQPGAEFVGNFVLPLKSADRPIVLRSAPSAALPPDGTRIHPGHAPALARIRSANTAAALRTAAGAHHWVLQYLEFGANQGGYGDIIQLGDGSSKQTTLESVPQHIQLSHLYVHGDPLLGQKRGIALNAGAVVIRDSHISDCKGVGIDTQAIGGWNGPGPYHIENNYIEGAGENVLFGGSDPAIPGLVTDGITFRRNHVARPLAWRNPLVATPQGVTATAGGGGVLPPGVYAYRIVARRPVGQGALGRSAASVEAVVAVATEGGVVQISWQPVPHAADYRVYGRTPGAEDIYWTVSGTTFVDTGGAGSAGAVPATAGSVWSVKNLFELKNARNVVVEQNIFENHWKESQPGYAIVFTPRNSAGQCTWCVVERVRFEHNIVRHVAAGINLLGYDVASRPTQQTNAIVIRNNVFDDVSTSYGGNAWFLLMGDAPRDVAIDHNTVSHNGTAFIFLYGGSATSPRQILNARITNNAARHGSYGVNGEHFGYGNGVINAFLPGGVVTANFLPIASASKYPAGNLLTGSFEGEFVAPAAGDYRLRDDSVLRGAGTDGWDIGADIARVMAAARDVVAGTSLPVPAPMNVRVVDAGR